MFLKSVVQSIPTYAMTCFLLPKDLCNDINNKMSNFWWKQQKDKRGMHWLSWDKMCKRKNEGRMGFRDMYMFHKALLGKQGWRLM